MQVILLGDVDRLGHKGDVVEVADGYARNYLLPRTMAMKASPGALEQAEGMSRARAQLNAEQRDDAQEIATRLVSQPIEVSAKAGPEGQLFGSVTTAEISEAVAAQADIEIDRRDLHVDEPIKSVGSHQVTAKLHAEVEFPITVEVVAG